MRVKILFLAVTFGVIWFIGFIKPFGLVGNVVACVVGALAIVKTFHWARR